MLAMIICLFLKYRSYCQNYNWAAHSKSHHTSLSGVEITAVAVLTSAEGWVQRILTSHPDLCISWLNYTPLKNVADTPQKYVVQA